jgi:poly(3-hydroxybutyrate) depolymerase
MRGVPLQVTLLTSGVKAPDCADSKCGPWSYLREYYVTLPLGYDSNKAYTLVIQAPGLGGTGKDSYSLASGAGPDHDNVDNTAIRVGLTPPPDEIGHATNPDQGSFDESEGDDSVDFVFYETLYDLIAQQLCFDRNRVFTNGNGSGGGRIVDQLACKYAGDRQRPIRGVISNGGGWSNDPRFLPTCSNHPMAGMWVHEVADPNRPWMATKLAIARAMSVDGCTIGTGYDDAQLVNFPISDALAPDTCQRIAGCSPLAPLVVCLLPGAGHGSHDAIVNPGANVFINLFQHPPLHKP